MKAKLPPTKFNAKFNKGKESDFPPKKGGDKKAPPPFPFAAGGMVRRGFGAARGGGKC